MIHHREHSRGFLLVELIGSLALLTVFALISTVLFTQTMHVIGRAPAAEESMIRFESFSQTLRADAWGSIRFSDLSTNAIQLDMPNQPGVHWQIDATGDIERTQGSDQRRWAGVGANAMLEIDGPCIVFRSVSQSTDAAAQLRCLSLVQLAAMSRGNSK